MELPVMLYDFLGVDLLYNCRFYYIPIYPSYGYSRALGEILFVVIEVDGVGRETALWDLVRFDLTIAWCPTIFIGAFVGVHSKKKS